MSLFSKKIDWGQLRKTFPVSPAFGDRGLCVDRWYIERFLKENAADIRGRALEIADDTYTRKFGGSRVTRADILHREGNPKANFVADLADGTGLPSATFDCVLLTQTLHHIYDVRAALTQVARILAPGGALLATDPGISQVSRYDMDRWGDFWRFTSLSFRRLAEEAFPGWKISVMAHGNVLAATAFLQGIAAEELDPKELEAADPDYELLLTLRAEKPC